MITVDPEASKEGIRAGRDIFMAFGSTRLLGYALLILGVSLVVGAAKEPSMELLLWALALIGMGFALLAVSYVIRPHDGKRQHKATPAETQEQP